MRECLGWITSCSNDQDCPQNWLELSVTELPTAVGCHVCGARVDLVVSEDEVRSRAGAGGVAAFPVIPCVALVGAPRGVPGGQSAGRPTFEGAPPRAPTPLPPPKAWTVRLSNGEVVKLDKDAMVIGRSRTCDVVIPSAKVSRQHASLSRVEGDYFIEDLGSANGVWLNGEKVTRIRVSHGDVYTISDELLTFEQR
jgi:hypothetical protein